MKVIIHNPSRLINLLIPLIFAVYAVGRLVSAQTGLVKPRLLADTNAYLRISRQPLLDAGFWGSTRPFVFPLFLKISGQDVRRTSVFQLVFSILTWGFLALRVARIFQNHSREAFQRPPPEIDSDTSAAFLSQTSQEFALQLANYGLPVAAFSLILLFSLDRHITGWDFVMMTESLSVSFLALFIAIGIWCLEGWQISKVVLFCLSGVALAFTRDTNAWLLLMLAGLLTFTVIMGWSRPRVLTLAAVFGIIFLISNANANLGGRWVFPLSNLIAKRVLTDHAAVAFFKSCGMPVTPKLLRVAGKFANAEERLLFEDPELNAFRIWLQADGKSCYIRWIISTIAPRIRQMMAEFDRLISFSEVDKFFARRYDPLMPIVVGNFFYPERFSLWIWVICACAAFVAIWRRLWVNNPLWFVFIALAILTPAHLFLTWHGDAMAPERHSLSVGVQLYLGFWILVLLGLDWARSSKRS